MFQTTNQYFTKIWGFHLFKTAKEPMRPSPGSCRGAPRRPPPKKKRWNRRKNHGTRGNLASFLYIYIWGIYDMNILYIYALLFSYIYIYIPLYILYYHISMCLYVVVHHFLNMLAEPPLVSSYKSLVELGFLDTLHYLANKISPAFWS